MHLALATNSSIHEKGATIFGLVILTRRTWHATLLQATEPNRTTQQHITVLTAPNVTRHPVTPRLVVFSTCDVASHVQASAAPHSPRFWAQLRFRAPVPDSGSGLSDARDALDEVGQNGTGPQVETS